MGKEEKTGKGLLPNAPGDEENLSKGKRRLRMILK